MNFLETEDVVKQYANHLALNKVSIQVPEGKVFGLLGPNGAGKTTLIRIINRITAPDSGLIRFNGREFQPEDIYQIGYLPEERGLYKKMKVGEQAIYLAQLKGLSYQEARTRLMRWFEKFDIMPWWNKKLEELSKGMQQKVQFIITIETSDLRRTVQRIRPRECRTAEKRNPRTERCRTHDHLFNTQHVVRRRDL